MYTLINGERFEVAPANPALPKAPGKRLSHIRSLPGKLGAIEWMARNPKKVFDVTRRNLGVIFDGVEIEQIEQLEDAQLDAYPFLEASSGGPEVVMPFHADRYNMQSISILQRMPGELQREEATIVTPTSRIANEAKLYARELLKFRRLGYEQRAYLKSIAALNGKLTDRVIAMEPCDAYEDVDFVSFYAGLCSRLEKDSVCMEWSLPENKDALFMLFGGATGKKRQRISAMHGRKISLLDRSTLRGKVGVVTVDERDWEKLRCTV